MLARLRAALSGSSGTASKRRGSTSSVTAAAHRHHRSLDVAVVGGGAGGLAAARELRREGHRATVFEQTPDAIGGVWVYDEAAVDARPLGVGDGQTAAAAALADPAANATERQAPPLPWTQTVHGSMYRDLRTNLPREVMGYLDFPFSADFRRAGGAGAAGRGSSSNGATPAAAAAPDPRRYPGHAEVLAYLEAYADAFDLRRHLRLGRRVVRATPLRDEDDEDGKDDGNGNANGNGPPLPPLPGPRWRVETVAVERNSATGRLRPAESSSSSSSTTTPPPATETQTFDALVVANGHYALPNLPAVAVAASSKFPGEQLHSHNYRSPVGYRGKRVVVVGASNSGGDIADEIAAAGAELVVLSARGWRRREAEDNKGGEPATAAFDRPNVRRRGMLRALNPDGSCAFDDDGEEGDGDVSRVDAVIYATGYRYAFDFLDEAFPHHSASDDGGEGDGDGNGNGDDNPPLLLRWRDEPGRVAPLFLHMFPARGDLAPRLSFLGLPWKVVPFPLMQLQARLVARLLSGRTPARLPAEAERLAACAADDAARRAKGLPARHTHVLDGEQWAYNAELLRLCGTTGGEGANDNGDGDGGAAPASVQGEPPIPGSWRARMYNSARDNKRKPHPGGPSAYRDRWEDEGTAAEAAAEFEALWVRRREEGEQEARAAPRGRVTTAAAS